jgi:hypothetical protein
LVQAQAGLIHAHLHVGQFVLNDLKVANRSAELGSLLGEIASQFNGTLSLTD